MFIMLLFSFVSCRYYSSDSFLALTILFTEFQKRVSDVIERPTNGHGGQAEVVAKSAISIGR